VYALTADGCLYEFTEKKKLDRWMNIKVERAFSLGLDFSSGILYCACSEGVIRVFDSKSLKHLNTFHKPPPLGQVNFEAGIKKITV